MICRLLGELKGKLDIPSFDKQNHKPAEADAGISSEVVIGRWAPVDKDIEVFCRTWLCMDRDRMTADNDISHVMRVQSGQEFF
jgi:hypothetical protein